MMLIRSVGSLLVACAALVAFSSPAAAQAPRTDAAGDVSGGYSIMRDSASLTFNGFRFSVAKNLSESWAGVVEIGRDSSGEPNVLSSGMQHFTYTDKTFLGGIRLRRFDGSSTAPFFQALAGYFGRSDSFGSPTKSNFAVRAEGGLDVRVANHLALRLGGGWTFLSAGVHYMNQIGANVGVAYLFGRR